MYTVYVQLEKADERVFMVTVTHDDTQCYRYRVRVSPKTIDQYDLDDKDLPDVIENAFLFLLDHEPPKEILPSFELMTITTYFPEFTPGTDR